MALWQATVKKHSSLFGEAWSNVYIVNAIDAFNALEIGTNLFAAERNVSYETVIFDQVHVIDLGDHERTRTNNLNSLPGLLPVAGLGGPLPLFNCVRVIFVNLSGKPEQKYLRLGANEANLSLGRWDGEFVDFVQTNYADPLAAMTEYVGPGDEAHIDASVVPEVQNRQLGWKRKHKPGFKRGWVPV